jgi:hypothetical protein
LPHVTPYKKLRNVAPETARPTDVRKDFREMGADEPVAFPTPHEAPLRSHSNTSKPAMTNFGMATRKNITDSTDNS